MENIKRAVGDASIFISRAVQDTHITDEASVMYSRAKQFTEEKLGKAEKTDNDPRYEELAMKTDNIKNCTEKLIRNSEAVLVPNPAARLETFMFETIPVDKIGVTNNRQNNLEYLGSDMIEAGNKFGPTTPYGSALIRVGHTEKNLGSVESKYIKSGHEGMIAPLQQFLDSNMRNITKERKIMENKRLDLDACKNKVRKYRAMLMQPAKEGVDPRALLDQAESELRIAQADYDKQVEITILLMEGLSSIQVDHVKHLQDFVSAQCQYYLEAHQIMNELNKDLSSISIMGNGQTATPILRTSLNEDEVSNNNAKLDQINLASPPPTTTMDKTQADFF